MKKTILLPVFIAVCSVVSGSSPQTIELNSPDLVRTATLSEALQGRKAVREYADRELSLQDLSDLLWAANGFNREDKRTAPTAMNQQEIDIYVCTAAGAYLYDAKAARLKKVSDIDLRAEFAAGQEYAAKAPVILLIVADLNRTRANNEQFRTFSRYDAGIVSQNISLFCAGAGMGTVCRAFMNKEKIAAALGLGDNHILHLNHPVGYIKQ